MVLGKDFKDDVGKGNRVDKEALGIYGGKERDAEGEVIVDLAERMEMVLVNTYFKN